MRPIPKKQREEMEQQAFFGVCAFSGHGQGDCAGRITWDHPFIFGGQQIIDPHFTVPLCTKHHNVDEYQDDKSYKKALSMWVALNRATPEELRKYSKAVNYEREKARLNELYGSYDEVKAISSYILHKPKQNAVVGRIKPFWVPLNEDQKQKVQTCINYYADIHDHCYSPFQMVDKMIDSCFEALPKNDGEYHAGKN